ncbi:hypothetical protein O6H91_02G127300 [Diphasiastrum complanatum]|uniref:Uncharacterized protein n=1 Tax=Diphasiastrum complanatum TaxID=34168 RepID=A0ACC2EKR7_DIPCM|nr:hypothetical protein O6H91_02G127300 [Diphasiastrum complanatum]
MALCLLSASLSWYWPLLHLCSRLLLMVLARSLLCSLWPACCPGRSAFRPTDPCLGCDALHSSLTLLFFLLASRCYWLRLGCFYTTSVCCPALCLLLPVCSRSTYSRSSIIDCSLAGHNLVFLRLDLCWNERHAGPLMVAASFMACLIASSMNLYSSLDTKSIGAKPTTAKEIYGTVFG